MGNQPVLQSLRRSELPTPRGGPVIRNAHGWAVCGGPRADADGWEAWIETLVNSADVHAVLALLFAERAQLGAWYLVANRLGGLLHALGNRWQRGSLSDAEEHAASAALQRALAMTAEAIVVPIDAPRCLLASAEGDDHTLGLSLAELCLRGAGWRAEWAGRHTRPVDICERVSKGAVHMVARSASAVMQDRKRLRTQLRDVGRCCQRAGVFLVLGGAGVWPDPPEFGQRLHRWEDFTTMLRDGLRK